MRSTKGRQPLDDFSAEEARERVVLFALSAAVLGLIALCVIGIAVLVLPQKTLMALLNWF